MDKSSHVTEAVPSLHRRSPKGQRSCGSRGPPRGDTFHYRTTKGKPCKRQPAVAPSQMPTISRPQITTPSTNTGLLNVSNSRELTTKKKRVGKMRIENSSTRTQVPTQVTISYPQTSASKRGPSSADQLQPTAITVSRTTKVQKLSRCCKSRKALRNRTLRQRCKGCSEQETTPQMANITPATTTNALHANMTKPRTSRLKHRKETSKQAAHWDATALARNRKTSAFLRVNGRPQKQVDFYLLQDYISQEPMGSSVAQSTHVERSLKPNESLHNMTGECMLLLGSFKG